MRRHIPIGLIIFRFLLGPLLFLDALDGKTGAGFGVGLIAALLSDIFDGVIARRLGVATPKLREVDSWVDAWFCLCVAASAWLAHRETLLIGLTPLLVAWLATNLLTLAFDWLKFRRFAAYHAYSSKLAGIFLFIAMFSLFVFGGNRLLLGVALCVSILSHLERMAITVVMPKWTPDVLSLWHALKRQTEPKQS